MSAGGDLTVILGPMSSGKTTELWNMCKVAIHGGLSVLFINHADDNRSETFLSSHDPVLNKVKLSEVEFDATKTDKLMDILCVTENYDMIAVDECQRFNDLPEFTAVLVNEKRKEVVIAGLNCNSDEEPMGKIKDVILLADNIILKKGYCVKCKDQGRKRVFAIRSYKFAGDPTNKNEIGGQDKYMAVCRNCFSELTKNKFK